MRRGSVAHCGRSFPASHRNYIGPRKWGGRALRRTDVALHGITASEPAPADPGKGSTFQDFQVEGDPDSSKQQPGWEFVVLESVCTFQYGAPLWLSNRALVSESTGG